MRYTSYNFKACRIEVAAFEVEGGRSEYHLKGHITDISLDFIAQAKALTEGCTAVQEKLSGAVPVFGRYFLSDAANQEMLIRDLLKYNIYPQSIVEQPPLDGSRIAIWLYLQTGVETKMVTNDPYCPLYEVKHGEYRQLWSNLSTPSSATACQQTREILTRYASSLEKEDCTLADNALRTWIFVRDVDRDYKGMVKGRNKAFDELGLTQQGHFIASTGIGGKSINAKTQVIADAFAIKGVNPEQIKYLYAPSKMSRTSDYGVRFERGTAVDFDGRRLVIVSGTASIDNQGEVMYHGDVRRQTERMWENVEALLAEAETGFEDVGYMIVYLRNMADYSIVKQMFDKRFPQIPRILTLAPVCRPEWLVEMECMAVKQL